MPRNPVAVKLSKVETSRDTVRRTEAMLADARREFRKHLLAANEAGVSLAELARRSGTSPSRMVEHIRRARAERVA